MTGGEPAADAIKKIAADDWTDQDLLTREEARERLVAEIDLEASALEGLDDGSPDPRVRAEVELRTRRLNALRAAAADNR
ncbi:MAG TPA: hypothetical protein VGG75_24005 [Trebonia sp.]|jgi:hypothetical protein